MTLDYAINCEAEIPPT